MNKASERRCTVGKDRVTAGLVDCEIDIDSFSVVHQCAIRRCGVAFDLLNPSHSSRLRQLSLAPTESNHSSSAYVLPLAPFVKNKTLLHFQPFFCFPSLLILRKSHQTYPYIL